MRVPWEAVEKLRHVAPQELLRLLDDAPGGPGGPGRGPEGGALSLVALLDEEVRWQLRRHVAEGVDSVQPQVVAALKLLSEEARTRFLHTGVLDTDVEPSLAAALRVLSVHDRQQLRRRWGTLDVDTDPAVKAAMRLL